ncbi:beta-aspartyl-peptidase [Marilutibacter aestuarii]|uniref:Isoaspartyl dipeptidase n=1 Tax=Marilutibacter aestuarii TaxID=1706195 RepID=A0A507ZX85_9GAMM|nr:beta-aspartyl-peptidase [Lysobacter aestuarii]TQD40874.1 beta-aspartyl-peptidase [Lysobacter aestuarii]
MHEIIHIRGVDCHAPAPLGRQDLLVAAGRVLAVAPSLDPGGLGHPVRTVDGDGLLACPGLVDSLVHFGGGGGEGGFATRTAPLEPRDAIAAGVTTLVGALGTDDITRSHADLLAHARALGAHGLSGYVLTGSYRVPVRTLTGSVRDDLVLIPEVIGVGEIAIADHRGSQPGVEEMARIAADSRVGGMLAGKAGTVLVHVGDGAEGLDLIEAVARRYPIPATQWHPTHVNRHAALLAQGERWARSGGRIDLTASTTPALIEAGEVPAAEALARLLANGIGSDRITLSSDGQASLPQFDAAGRLVALDVAPIGSLVACLRDAVRLHGVSLADALAVVTRTPAQVWGLARKGRIAPGCDADLLLLDRGNLALRATVAGGRYHALG